MHRPAHPRIGPVRIHRPIKHMPWHVLQDSVEYAILMPHGVDPCPDTLPDVQKTEELTFKGFFENPWLIGAVALSLFAHVLVIYSPALQTAFQSVALSALDWLIATCVAALSLAVMELVKLGLAARKHVGRVRYDRGSRPQPS